MQANCRKFSTIDRPSMEDLVYSSSSSNTDLHIRKISTKALEENQNVAQNQIQNNRKISRKISSLEPPKLQDIKEGEILPTIPNSIPVKFKASVYPQIFVTFAATLGGFAMGTMEGYTSPGLPSMEEKGSFGPLGTNTQGQIASLALLAALFSGFPVGYLVDKVGRKAVICFLTLPFISGWALIASAQNLAMIYAGRILTGFSAGGMSLAVPIYISETAGVKIRGRLSSMFQLMVTLGNLFAYAAGSYLDWQILAIVCGIFPLACVLLMIWAPQSPRYLLSKGKSAQATAALMWLRSAPEKEVEAEIKSIQSSLGKKGTDSSSSFSSLFKSQSLKPLIICLSLFFFQQLSGIEAVLMYTVTIFRQSGSELDPNLASVIVGSLQVLSTLASASLVDRAGRRKLLLISQLGSSLSMAVLASFFFVKGSNPSIVDSYGWIPLVSLGTFIFTFALGVGPIPFLMISELNSASMVELASALGTTLNWLCSYLVTFGVMWVHSSFGGMHYCFAGFSVISFLGVIFTMRYCPETKGKSMEDIQKIFAKVRKISRSVVSAVFHHNSDVNSV